MQHTYMYIQCDARSPVKIQNSIVGVFSVNETSHYNTNEFLKNVHVSGADPSSSRSWKNEAAFRGHFGTKPGGQDLRCSTVNRY